MTRDQQGDDDSIYYTDADEMTTSSSLNFPKSWSSNNTRYLEPQDEAYLYNTNSAMPNHAYSRWRPPVITRKSIFAIFTTLALVAIGTHSLRNYGPPHFRADSRGGRSWISSNPDHPTASLAAQDPYCNQYQDPGNIAVVVKTGATELQAKVPVLLNTTLRCVDNPILISDLEQKLGPHKVHDALDRISPVDVKFNSDFDLYRLQQEYMKTGKEADIHELKNMPVAAKSNYGNRKAAWALDRYKFLYMVERSWEISPNKDWYFFMDADTYVNWPNLLRWVPQLDPAKKLYIGHLIGFNQYPHELPLYFAHGGAGFLLSRATVEAFVNRETSIAKEWEPRMAKLWYGDGALAAALAEELDLYLTDAHMSMTENEPYNVAFERNRWCLPLLSMHHLKTKEEWNLLSEFDATQTGPATFRDLFHFLYPEGQRFPPTLDNWDNQVRDDGSWDWGTSLEVTTSTAKNKCPSHIKGNHPNDPHCSIEACELACVENEKCMQYQFKSARLRGGTYDLEYVTECSHSDAFRMGRERKPEIDWFDDESKETGAKWQSGWMSERIARWIEEHRECGREELKWPAV